MENCRVNLQTKKPVPIVILAVIAVFVTLTAAVTARCQVRASFVESRIKLDGFLREPDWKSADVVTGFTQMELVEGDPATEKTEVRILVDDENLYIGVMCFDSEPGGIIHRELKWDGDLSGDDSFELVLDTYHDRRMGFYFGVNPNGTQVDATFRSGSTTNFLTGLNREWDAIWEVAAVITDRGWSCEIMIPFKSLRFPTSDTQTWGVNFRRTIRRKNEEVLWRGWARNAGLLLLTQAGTLEIPGTVRPGKQVDVKPYILGGVENVRGKGSDDILKTGLEVKYGITSNMTIDLTTNTDFAQIESDREVINLTRFDIHYPEKRDFFLEGSDTFDFTQGGTRLFYSRRIGITPDRREQPILGGIKLTQKTGSYRLGVLAMRTKEKYGYPGANYTVARVKKDIFNQSYLGFILTNKYDETGHDNSVYGVDWGLKTDRFLGDKNLDIQGYLCGSMTDGRNDRNNAGRIYISYPNDFIDSFILYHALDEQFNPELGFARRVGIENYIWYTTISPRPDIPYIKKLVFKPCNMNYTTDMKGKLISRTVEIRPFGFVSDAGDEFYFSYRNEYDYVEKEFVKFDKLVFKQGVHDWWFYDTSFTSSRSRPVSFKLSTRWGDYYDGRRTAYSLGVTLKTNEHYAFSTDASVNDITIGDVNLVTREYGGRLSIDVTTRLSTSTFIQYNNETRRVNTNFRLHYIPKIGSDLYLVYNHLMDEEDDFRTLQNAAMLKMDYIYRF